MKLFKVEITYEIVILAENWQSAEEEAPFILRNEDDSEPSVGATEIKSLKDLPFGWDAKCYPFKVKRDDKFESIEELLK